MLTIFYKIGSSVIASNSPLPEGAVIITEEEFKAGYGNGAEYAMSILDEESDDQS